MLSKIHLANSKCYLTVIRVLISGVTYCSSFQTELNAVQEFIHYSINAIREES